MTDVLFPVVAADTPEAGGTITAWRVADGDTVTQGQVLCEVSVTKAFGEIESPAAGIVRLLCAAEDSVVQGTVIASRPRAERSDQAGALNRPTRSATASVIAASSAR